MNIKRKVLALLLVVAMVCSMLPAAVAANGFAKAKTWDDGLFTDVAKGDWFYENVKGAYELGLMVGCDNSRFDPYGKITLAQTVAVAARIHAIAASGAENFVQGDPWYRVYVDYALANGILDGELVDYNREATRLEFARILVRALPAKDLNAINSVKYGDIPDVAYDEAVYTLYRAGVLIGKDTGEFGSDDIIDRCQMATIVTRMALPELREKIEKEEDNSGSTGGNIWWPSFDWGNDDEENVQPVPTPVPTPEDDVKVTVSVESENGAVKNAVSLESEEVKATVPAGVTLEEGAQELTLTVNAMESTASDVTPGENEEMTSYDVHIEGVAEDNTVVITVALGAILPKGLNMGNVELYHVEDGATNAMQQVLTLSELDAHNEFYYDPATGEVTVAMSTFSEIAVVSEEAKWEGEYDYTWYDANANELTIANADQLAAFGAIVGGMDGQTQDSFSGKTVKLISDINLGDKESENNENLIFYPIGYYNSTGSYTKTSGGSVTSSVSSFEGTFDGNGNTISNFYQNTWEMFGDYNDGYSGTPNHYKDAMGLFGYVVNGTVKNLTVDNFSSDGEFTPTGVIAAYAVNSTFENIAITNCNPRVYNTGNGGIVGIGGNSDDPDTYKLTFTNITIDNTNKISALWGSWDVACGGLVGMFRGAGHVYMTNCHVAAQIDVYNDVCGNYQYYWYRYAGMMVGTNKNMTTDANGYTVPETDKFHAENCTVHFGEWNDYYYCELVANSLASYTHDHQFSRLTQISSLDEIKSGDTWTKAGNFLLISGDTKTCYHIVNKDGVLTQHLHTDAGEETVNGETVLKEDKQIVYLPFNQLFTGYGWGVKHIPVYNGEDYAFEGITILDREVADSVVKFEGKGTTQAVAGEEIKVGNLFKAKNPNATGVEAIHDQAVIVSVIDLNETGITAVYTQNESDWTQGTLVINGTGKVRITIQDYRFCTPTSIEVEVVDEAAAIETVDRFVLKFPNTKTYLYRVGNLNTVPLNKLFGFVEGQEDNVGSISVDVETIVSASGTPSNATNVNLDSGTIQFNGTGVVKVTISDDNYSTPVDLYLEVVDAVNATTATSATANNVVLLNDVSFSTVDVKNGYTLYGNGFTMTAPNDVLYHSLTVGFVTMDNGTLDNVQIVVPNYSYQVLYNSNMTESSNYYDSNSQKYGNVRSAVMVSGNSKILNSRVSGGRAAVYVIGGNPVIDNSTIVGGAAANVHVVAGANSLTLRDVTMIQVPTQATVHDTSKTLMGLSVLMMCGDSKYGAKITLEGYLNQYAWAHEGYKEYVPSQGQSFVSYVLSKDEYIHEITYADGNNYNSLNLGFAFLPTGTTAPADPVAGDMIVDNRTDGKVYGSVNINGSAYVYSYKGTNGTSADVATQPDYSSNAQAAIRPTVTFTDANENRIFETKYDATKGWMSTLTVDVDAGNYNFSFDKLLAQKYGQNLAYTVKKADGTSVDKSPVVTLNDSSTAEYILTITDNLIYGANGELSGEPAETKYTFMLLSTKTSLPAPTWLSQSWNTDTYPPLIVGDNTSGDWNVALPVLEGLEVRYYSKAQQEEVDLALGDINFATKGKQADSNTLTVTKENEYTLTITTKTFHSADNGVPVYAQNEVLYFTVASSGGYVSTKTTERTVSISYVFTDANNSTSLTWDTSWNVKYSDYSNNTRAKLSSLLESGTIEEPCFVEGTLITMADGTQKAVEDLVIGDMVLAFNHVTGQLEAAPIIFNTHADELEARKREVLYLEFSNGEEVKIVGSHGFFDMTLMQYVYVTDENYLDFVGHEFYYAGADGTVAEKATLSCAYVETETVRVFCPVTYFHMNSIANGFLNTPNIPGGITGLVNYFEYDADLKYNEEKMQADIEKYGLYTYEDFSDYISEAAYNSSPAVYLKVAVGKGMITYEEIIAVIEYLLAGSLIE